MRSLFNSLLKTFFFSEANLSRFLPCHQTHYEKDKNLYLLK